MTVAKKQRKDFLIVIPRISNDEQTIAIVMCSASRAMEHSQVLAAIRTSVERWLATPEGQEEWEASSEDFNWGDLSCCTDSLLEEMLAENGVHKLRIDTYVSLNEDRGLETYDSIFYPEQRSQS